MIGALNDNASSIFNKMYEMVGAGMYACSAADAFLGINSCYVILYGYSILRASCGAVTVTEARVFTFFVTVVKKVGGNAVFNAFIIIFSLNRTAFAVAGNVSNLFYNVFGFNTERTSNALCGFITAGDAKISCCCAF